MPALVKRVRCGDGQGLRFMAGNSNRLIGANCPVRIVRKPAHHFTLKLSGGAHLTREQARFGLCATSALALYYGGMT